ncbi:MAG TPA: hypothetical protein VKI19_03290, partial [Acidimicrobiales bacterium]|nr:hypothetical protein [Acidimicrobiales bacterium]
VDAALAASGMKIYFTEPHTVEIGGADYYTAASLLFYWLPPGSHNTFTMSLGGSGVAVSDGQNPDAVFTVPSTVPTTTPATVGSTGPVAAPAPLPAAGGTPTSGGGPGSVSLAGVSSPAANPSDSGTKLSLPAPPSAAQSVVPASARLPGGIGVGWWILAILAALAAAGLTTRVPALLTRQAAADCPRATRSRSSFGK